jgi:hypothetical protein
MSAQFSVDREETMTIRLDEILNVLDLSEASGVIMETLLARRLTRVAQQLGSFIAEIGGRPDVAEIIAVYNDLSAVARARVLSSGELGEFLNIWAPPDGHRPIGTTTTEEMLNIVRREQLIQRISLGEYDASFEPSEGEDRIWSPLGDRYVARIDGVWSLLTAPSIGGVVTVDFDSPIARRFEVQSGVLSRPRLEMSSDEQEQVRIKFDTALAEIDRLAPAYGLIIRNFTRRIIIRKSIQAIGGGGESSSGVFVSEHVPRQTGVIRFLNPHLTEYTISMCMESLLHESIHTFLTAYEQAFGQFTPRNMLYRPVSSWSGNPIPNSSYAHAVFVYYACHKLFERCLSSNVTDAPWNYEEMRARIPTFGVGFLIRQRLSEQFLVTGPLSADFVRTIDEMQQRVRAFYNNISMMVQAA